MSTGGNSGNGESLKKSFKSVSKSTLTKSATCSSDNLSQTCSVCAESEPKFWSVSPCNHKICWICSLRLRALYGSKACPICKSDCETVFICKRPEEGDEFFKSKKGGPVSKSIAYDNEVTRTNCETLLQLQCPFIQNNNQNGKQQPCGKHFKNKFELRKHVLNVHELQMCEICLEHKKCFTVELPLYNRTSLQKHQREANHPRCQVCDRIFYSEDELAEHCRDEHELCHICQRSGRLNRYFQNYTKLEEHFGKEHFLCPEPLCRELKFVVFGNELEYKAHQAEVHLAHQKLQRSQQRQLQRLNISFNTNTNTVNSSSTSTSTSTTNSTTSSALKLTPDQRNQIGANLIYGEVTDELANRLQSLSLYQNRNDEFIDTLRGTFHLTQNQIQAIFQAARTYQRDECDATEFLLKIEKILGNLDSKNLIKICIGLSDLQLDDMRRQKLTVAIKGYQEKCSEFPELAASKNKGGGSSKKVTWTSTTTGPSKLLDNEEDEKEKDPFGHLKTSANSSKPPGFSRDSPKSQNPFSNSSVKVLQIVKPSKPTGNPLPKSSDPSKNPAVLLSQLAGGPALKNTSKKKTGTVKMTTFSSAALGSVTSSSKPGNSSFSKGLDEEEFPSLNPTTTTTTKTTTNNHSTFPTPSTPTTSNTSAFFAPSDRDQVESFTIGNSEEQPELATTTTGKSKKSKKVVFRYGQKWDI